jgi:ABC-type polysaccharide/polyol phosphate export permease
MLGAAVYGFFLGLGALLFIQLAPQPSGLILWWGFFAIQLTWGASLCWRRTRLPFATTAMVIAAASSGTLAVLAAVGHVFPDLPRTWWVPVGVGLFSSPLLFLVESRVHREKWMQWKQLMEQKNAWDILKGRHIPQLPDSGA